MARVRSFVTRATWGLLIGGLGAMLAPFPAAASHPNAGDCPHVHDLPPPLGNDPTFSVCVRQSTGTVCERTSGGVPMEGTCQHEVIDTGNPPKRGTQCLCVTPKDEVQALQITRMSEATQAALTFPGVRKALKKVDDDAACTQLNTQFRDIRAALDGVTGASPIEFYDPEIMRRLDLVIGELPRVTGWAFRCSPANIAPFTKPNDFRDSALGMLAGFKRQMSDSYANRIPTDAPCSTGDFAAVDGYSCSVQGSPACGISSFVIDASSCPTTVENFGTNGSVPFPLKNGGTDTLSATDLTILGQPDHTCDLQVTMNGSTEMDLSCTSGGGGSCASSFVCVGGP